MTGPHRTEETFVFAPRNLVIAGVVLIAVALGASGNGLWWLVGFLWFLPHVGGQAHRCRGAVRGCGHAGAAPQARRSGEHATPSSEQASPSGEASGSGPDAHHDRHVAFPEAR